MPLTVPELVPVVFLGIVNTGVGCYLYFSSIQRLPAGVVAVCGYLEPLSALMFSAIFLHERLTAVQLLGAFLIIGGAAFAASCARMKEGQKIPKEVRPLGVIFYE